MPRKPEPPSLKLNERDVWEIRWSEKGRSKRHSTGLSGLTEAQKYFAGWLAGEAEQEAAKDDPESVTVAQVVARYILDRQPRKSVLCRLDMVVEHLGQTRVVDITRQVCRDYIATRGRARPRARNRRARVRTVAGKLSTSTIRNEFEYLRAALNHAKAEKLIAVVPALDMPANAPPRELYMTETELPAMLQAARDLREGTRISPTEMWMWLAAYTAARPDAILGLTWDRVKWGENLIDYRDPTIPEQPKKRRVAVPIAAPLRAILEQAYRERGASKFVCGTRMVDYQLLIQIQRATRRAGINKPITAYTFRHTWATQASMRGVPMTDIARVMGNSVTVCERHYAKYHPAYLSGAVNMMPDLRTLEGAAGNTPNALGDGAQWGVMRGTMRPKRGVLASANAGQHQATQEETLSVGQVGRHNATPGD